MRSGLGGFLYLNVLDASFSFDGVIGAFALSNNMIVIALGLSIGAMFVRSMTIIWSQKGTLAEYRYLEHGAFWAIIALGAIMLLSARCAHPRDDHRADRRGADRPLAVVVGPPQAAPSSTISSECLRRRLSRAASGAESTSWSRW